MPAVSVGVLAVTVICVFTSGSFVNIRRYIGVGCAGCARVAMS